MTGRPGAFAWWYKNARPDGKYEPNLDFNTFVLPFYDWYQGFVDRPGVLDTQGRAYLGLVGFSGPRGFYLFLVGVRWWYQLLEDRESLEFWDGMALDLYSLMGKMKDVSETAE